MTPVPNPPPGAADGLPRPRTARSRTGSEAFDTVSAIRSATGVSPLLNLGLGPGPDPMLIGIGLLLVAGLCSVSRIWLVRRN